MKKNKIIINSLLIFTIIVCIIALALICPLISDNLDAYSKVLTMSENEIENNGVYKDVFLEALQSNAISKIISIIFSALAAIASAVIFFLLNFKIWKEKHN